MITTLLRHIGCSSLLWILQKMVPNGWRISPLESWCLMANPFGEDLTDVWIWPQVHSLNLPVWPAFAEDPWKPPCTSTRSPNVLEATYAYVRTYKVCNASHFYAMLCNAIRSWLNTWIFSMPVLHCQHLLCNQSRVNFQAEGSHTSGLMLRYCFNKAFLLPLAVQRRMIINIFCPLWLWWYDFRLLVQGEIGCLAQFNWFLHRTSCILKETDLFLPCFSGELLHSSLFQVYISKNVFVVFLLNLSMISI